MPLRILFAYEKNADDILVQSGRPHSILMQLRARAHVINLSPLDTSIRRIMRPAEWAFGVFGRRYSGDRERIYLRWLARQVEATLSEHHCDVVFSPGSQAVSLLRFDLPIVFCADAPFGAMVDFYEDFSHIALRYRTRGFEQEAEAHARCAAAIYPSQWAADTAIKVHGAAAERTHVIPFGANVEAPDEATIEQMLDARSGSTIHVLFVGCDWARKGGDLAVAACRHVRKAGLNVVLHVVGVAKQPDSGDPWIVMYGFLNKTQVAHRATLQRLLYISRVFFTPSRAEAYGMSFCEAAAWAMPSLTTAVGGIPTIVKDGVTGWTLAPNAGPPEYAKKLFEMTADHDRYRAMAWRARRDYESRLNWSTFTEKLWGVFDDVCR